MDNTVLYVPRGNDVIVTARFPSISSGIGMTSEFWLKPDKTTIDTDPSVIMVSSSVQNDPDNVGATMSTFSVAAADNSTPGAFWWRVDVLDTLSNRRTADAGTWLVEAV